MKENTQKQRMYKGILLYVGYNGYNGTKYYVPTDEELEKLLSVTDEILLIPIVMYNRYTDEQGNIRQVMSRDVIENMTVDMVGSPQRFETIKGEYFATAEPRVRANYHVDDYINDSVSLARRLVAINKDVRLWFSVPQAECLHALTHLFAEAWVSVVHGIKNALEPEIWEHNVQGIYHAGEDIVTAGYTKFDFTAPERNFDNPIVYSMRAVSDAVHAYGKNFLWIPYYDTAASSAVNMGHVVNLTNIFDTVILQPSYFFRDIRFPGIKAVTDSVAAQKIVDLEGNVVGGKKVSDTVIGFEMEIDTQFFDNEDYQKRYYTYEEAFGNFVGKYPTAYYAGCPDTAVRLTDLMSKFFSKNK